MAVTEVVGLKSLFEDPPHFQFFKHHTELVEDGLRLTTFLVAMVGFTEYIMTNDKIICSTNEGLIKQNEYSSNDPGMIREGRVWLKVANHLCEDELTSLAERWMPHLMVVEGLLVISLQRLLFRGLRTENTFMRLYDYILAILAPKDNTACPQTEMPFCLLDQRQLMWNYSYFLDELKNSFRLRNKAIRDNCIVLISLIMFSVLNIATLYIFSVASDELMMCRLTTSSFPDSFVPSNFTTDLVCFLTTKEGNYIIGCLFTLSLIPQIGYALWHLIRDSVGKSRLHDVMINCCSSHVVRKCDIPKTDFYFIMRLMDGNVSLPSQLILLSSMNKELMDFWHCDVQKNNIVITTNSVTFKLETPTIFDYVQNKKFAISDDLRVYTWINNDKSVGSKSSVKENFPGDEVTFELLGGGKSTISGCIAYRNRLVGEILMDDFIFETTPHPPDVEMLLPDSDGLVLTVNQYCRSGGYKKKGIDFIEVGRLKKSHWTSEKLTHDVNLCKIEFCLVTVGDIKSKEINVGADADQVKSRSGDSFVDLVLTGLDSGVAIYVTAICVKTKYSNWSESMELEPQKQLLCTQPSPPANLRIRKHVNDSSDTKEKFEITWNNSDCKENHHYVIKGRLSVHGSDNITFIANIYPKSPETTELIVEEPYSQTESIINTNIPQLLYTNETETSIVLPPSCSFVTELWCQIDDLKYNGTQYKGERSEHVKVGGDLMSWIDRHDPQKQNDQKDDPWAVIKW